MRYDLAYVTGNLSNTEKGQSKFAAWLVQFVRKYIEMDDSMCIMLTCYVLFFRSCAGFFKASLSLNGASEKIVLPGCLRQQRFIWYMREQFNFVIILFYDIWNAVQLDSSNLQIHQPFFSNFSSNLRRRHGKLTVILCKTTSVWYTYFFLKYFSFQVNFVGRRACTYS